MPRIGWETAPPPALGGMSEDGGEEAHEALEALFGEGAVAPAVGVDAAAAALVAQEQLSLIHI